METWKCDRSLIATLLFCFFSTLFYNSFVIKCKWNSKQHTTLIICLTMSCQNFQDKYRTVSPAKREREREKKSIARSTPSLPCHDDKATSISCKKQAMERILRGCSSDTMGVLLLFTRLSISKTPPLPFPFLVPGRHHPHTNISFLA